MKRRYGCVPVDDAGLIDGLLGARVVLCRARDEIERLAQEALPTNDDLEPAPDRVLVAVILGIYTLERRCTAWLAGCDAMWSDAAPAGSESLMGEAGVTVPRELLR